eukprot:gene1189-4179_t
MKWLEWEQRRAAVRAVTTGRIFQNGEPAVLRRMLPKKTLASLPDRKLRHHTKGCVVTVGARRKIGEKAFSVWGAKVLNAIAKDAVFAECPQGPPHLEEEGERCNKRGIAPPDSDAVIREGWYAFLRHRFAGQPEWKDSKGRVIVWTDGSSRADEEGNDKAGAGIFYGYTNPRNAAVSVPGTQSNIHAELFAILHVLRTDNRWVAVRSDCRYVVDGINLWRHQWRARAWFARPMDGHLYPHTDLWREVDMRLRAREQDMGADNFDLRWTKGHPLPCHIGQQVTTELDAYGNVGADFLAGSATQTSSAAHQRAAAVAQAPSAKAEVNQADGVFSGGQQPTMERDDPIEPAATAVDTVALGRFTRGREAITMKEPFASFVHAFLKWIETRSRALPPFIKPWVDYALIATPEDGGGARKGTISAFIRFGRCARYTDKTQWLDDSLLHRVSDGHPLYGWLEDGHKLPPFAWEITRITRCAPENLPEGSQHMEGVGGRTWWELPDEWQPQQLLESQCAGPAGVKGALWEAAAGAAAAAVAATPSVAAHVIDAERDQRVQKATATAVAPRRRGEVPVARETAVAVAAGVPRPLAARLADVARDPSLPVWRRAHAQDELTVLLHGPPPKGCARRPGFDDGELKRQHGGQHDPDMVARVKESSTLSRGCYEEEREECEEFIQDVIRAWRRGEFPAGYVDYRELRGGAWRAKFMFGFGYAWKGAAPPMPVAEPGHEFVFCGGAPPITQKIRRAFFKPLARRGLIKSEDWPNMFTLNAQSVGSCLVSHIDAGHLWEDLIVTSCFGNRRDIEFLAGWDEAVPAGVVYEMRPADALASWGDSKERVKHRVTKHGTRYGETYGALSRRVRDSEIPIVHPRPGPAPAPPSAQARAVMRRRQASPQQQLGRVYFPRPQRPQRRRDEPSPKWQLHRRRRRDSGEAATGGRPPLDHRPLARTFTDSRQARKRPRRVEGAAAAGAAAPARIDTGSQSESDGGKESEVNGGALSHSASGSHGEFEQVEEFEEVVEEEEVEEGDERVASSAEAASLVVDRRLGSRWGAAGATSVDWHSDGSSSFERAQATVASRKHSAPLTAEQVAAGRLFDLRGFREEIRSLAERASVLAPDTEGGLWDIADSLTAHDIAQAKEQLRQVRRSELARGRLTVVAGGGSEQPSLGGTLSEGVRAVAVKIGTDTPVAPAARTPAASQATATAVTSLVQAVRDVPTPAASAGAVAAAAAVAAPPRESTAERRRLWPKGKDAHSTAARRRRERWATTVKAAGSAVIAVSSVSADRRVVESAAPAAAAVVETAAPAAAVAGAISG